MATQNEPEQMELELDPVCKQCGCQQQNHFRTIRSLQALVKALEEKLSAYDKE